MNFNYRTIFLVCAFLSVVGCSSGGEQASGEVGLTPVIVEEVGYPVLPQSDYNIELRLVNALIDSTLMDREAPVQVRFTVWAFDELVADVSATKVAHSEFSLRPQAVAYPLRFSEQDLQAVEYQSGSPDALKFYITLEVDVDRDGVVCNGDYRQNFSVSRPEFYTTSRTAVERALEIVEIKGELC